MFKEISGSSVLSITAPIFSVSCCATVSFTAT